MSIHRSYFDKSNTLVYNSYTNTGRNPIVELFYGRVDNIAIPIGYSRYIFNIDLTTLTEKINDKTISTSCTGYNDITHTLRMTNTSFFDKELLNDKTSQGRRRATSFDLILFRIPQNQSWDSGVGYDYYDFDEDIEFDMTNEINSILSGGTTGVTGYGIAFYPQVENISGLTENYSVGFFSPHTQTFYEPFLETTYNDYINDDRNNFYAGSDNNLYLYVYQNGNPINLDSLPTVDILDSNGNNIDGFVSLTTCLVTKGIYKVNINGLNPNSVPCLYYDLWKNLSINGTSISNVENEFAILESGGNYQIGTTTSRPKNYGFSISGIKQNEKVLNTDIRKVNLTIKEAYTSIQTLSNVDVYYRIYVKEGANTEVQVQDWTKVNKTPDGYYFVFDTRDKIPNEYFVDVKVNSERNVDTYKRELQFQIVNKM